MASIQTSQNFTKFGNTYIHLVEIAQLASDLELPAGETYFTGIDFIAELTVWADSYENNHFIIWEEDKTREYFEARTEILKNEKTIVYAKTLSEFVNEIF